MTIDSHADSAVRHFFEEAVAAHVDLLYGAALRHVRDPHLADDVTQAVFLVLARKRDRLPAEGVLAPWLLKVTRYTALAVLRAQRRRRHHEAVGGVTIAAANVDKTISESSERTLIERENAIAALLDEALMALAESDRRLIVLRYLQNRPLMEVATLLKMRSNTAAKRAERALERPNI